MSIPRKLVVEYFAILYRHNLTELILRMPPDFVQYWEQNYRSMIRSDDTFDEASNPLRGLCPLQFVLDQARREIEGLHTAKGSGLGSKEIPPYLVAIFPTGALGAKVLSFDSGSLIFVNSATVILFMRMVKTALLATEMENCPPPIGRKEAVTTLANIFSGYLRHERTLPEEPLVSMELNVELFECWLEKKKINSRDRYYRALTQSLVRFVVAHELGHLLAGHLENHMLGIFETPVGKMSAVQRSRLQENEADLMAATTLIAYALHTTQTQETFDPSIISAATSPLVFFTIADMLDRLRERVGLGTIVSTTHPEAVERRSLLKQYYQNLSSEVPLPPIALQWPDIIDSWLRDLEEDIAKKIGSTRLDH